MLCYTNPPHGMGEKGVGLVCVLTTPGGAKAIPVDRHIARFVTGSDRFGVLKLKVPLKVFKPESVAKETSKRNTKASHEEKIVQRTLEQPETGSSKTIIFIRSTRP